MDCGPEFLRKPIIQNVEAMNNVLFTLAFELWKDAANTIPYDMTGYVGRGGLQLKNTPTGPVIPFTAIVITNSVIINVPTLITATLDKSTVETLLTRQPYIFDVSFDNSGTGDSFSGWADSVVTFMKGVSS
jgi:hypothetical protein